MYIVYATRNDGGGTVMEIGRFEDLEDITIRVGMFSKDVVINIEKENNELE